MKNKLKPCPFCGSKVEIIDLGIDKDDHYYMMQCSNEKCNSATCFGEVSKKEFIMLWNRRCEEIINKGTVNIKM